MIRLALLLLFGPSVGWAQSPLHGLAAKDGITVGATAMFRSVPPYGYAPLVLAIENRTDADHSYRVVTRAERGYGPVDRFSTERKVTVAARSKKEVEILTPLPNVSQRSNTMQLTLEVDGFGITRNSARLSGTIPSPYSSMRPTIALTADLEAQDKDRFVGNSSPFQLNVLRPQLMPSDWRGLIGVDALWMTAEDANNMSPTAIRSVKDWVLSGGSIVICHPENLLTPSQHPFQAHLGPYGYGRFEEMVWGGVGVTGPVRSKASATKARERAERTRGPFARKIGSNTVNRTLMLLFMLTFGVVIGPLNLFYLARRERRARLLWTTPLISVVASLLLVVLIFVQDGLGGSGARSVAVMLVPEESREVVIQEQISRTGVVPSSAFEVDEGQFLQQLELDDGFGTRSYLQEQRRYFGDFFQSRAVQAQRLTQVRASRARVERVAGEGPPQLVSSLPITVDRLYYLADGEVWETGVVHPGAHVRLEPSTLRNLQGVPIANEAHSSLIRDIIRQRLASADGWFLAMGTDGGPWMSDTLSSIEWEDQVLVMGAVVR